jgi:type IV secretory pathway TraG/TraD family ATPase VirD4
MLMSLTTVGTMALTAFGALVFLFSDCRPFATRWNPFLFVQPVYLLSASKEFTYT